LRQSCGVPWLAAQRIRNQLSQVLLGQRYERDLRYLPACVLDRIQLTPQRMRGIDLVVAVGADQQQMLHVRLG
jgi:hypothetical protein